MKYEIGKMANPHCYQNGDNLSLYNDSRANNNVITSGESLCKKGKSATVLGFFKSEWNVDFMSNTQYTQTRTNIWYVPFAYYDVSNNYFIHLIDTKCTGILT